MNPTKLKPCPFCGGADVDFGYADDQFKDHNVFVACGACKASSAIHPTKREARAAWNRRANPATSAHLQGKKCCGNCARFSRDPKDPRNGWCDEWPVYRSDDCVCEPYIGRPGDGETKVQGEERHGQEV